MAVVVFFFFYYVIDVLWFFLSEVIEGYVLAMSHSLWFVFEAFILISLWERMRAFRFWAFFFCHHSHGCALEVAHTGIMEELLKVFDCLGKDASKVLEK